MPSQPSISFERAIKHEDVNSMEIYFSKKKQITAKIKKKTIYNLKKRPERKKQNEILHTMYLLDK
jgi:hypothetical protein